ncbi:MAG: hypothetical protein LBD22_06110 [Spirochaetaceae bacterium]|jgi:hypothetical protein|nr:hypothetical protein [Spirochaetaceae bacterium]
MAIEVEVVRIGNDKFPADYDVEWDIPEEKLNAIFDRVIAEIHSDPEIIAFFDSLYEDSEDEPEGEASSQAQTQNSSLSYFHQKVIEQLEKELDPKTAEPDDIRAWLRLNAGIEGQNADTIIEFFQSNSQQSSYKPLNSMAVVKGFVRREEANVKKSDEERNQGKVPEKKIFTRLECEIVSEGNV